MEMKLLREKEEKKQQHRNELTYNNFAAVTIEIIL